MKVAILGVGLIGGSIGLAARRRTGAHVSGYDPDPGARAQALARGAIDEQADDVAGAVHNADVVFVATPVGALRETVREALAHAGPQSVVTDVGSTKRVVAEAGSDPRFIGGHPLAGAETAGVEHAREDLFEGAIWYLTPGACAEQTAPVPTAGETRLRELLAGFGAQPVRIDPDLHDRLMACVSHLPHVLANVLVAQAAGALHSHGGQLAEGRLDIGPSFRDATRVAGANTAVWTDIYLANRDALIAAIDDAAARLAEVRAALASGDPRAISSWNEQAHADRETLLSPDS